MKYFFAFIFLFLAGINISSAQTAGSSDLSSIESKANAIAQNDTRSSELNRKRMQSYVEEQDKLISMQNELALLHQKKAANQIEIEKKINAKLEEIENSTSWKNRRASAQSGWKEFNPGTCSAGGPPPICVAKHWYRVSVAEAMAEYEAYKNQVLDEIRKQSNTYDEAISSKETSITDFEYAENEYTRKRADWDKQMDDLKAKNDRLREEIVELSKSYKAKVIDESKVIQANWVNNLMQLIAEKHFIEDRIDIYNVRYGDLDKEEVKSTAAIKEKVVKQNDLEIKQNEDKIREIKSRIFNKEQLYIQKLAALNSNVSQLAKRIKEFEQLLVDNKTISIEETTRLTLEKNGLESKLEAVKKEITDTKLQMSEEIKLAESNVRLLDDENWQLKINLSKRQQSALEGVIEAYRDKRKIITDAIEARKAYLQQAGDHLIQSKSAYQLKNNQYAEKVDSERVRLIGACKLAGASCYGIDTHAIVVSNWNTLSGCVGQMENNKSMDYYYGCQEAAPVYTQFYKSYLNGLTDSDIEALQRTSSKTKYDLILQKVRN